MNGPLAGVALVLLVGGSVLWMAIDLEWIYLPTRHHLAGLGWRFVRWLEQWEGSRCHNCRNEILTSGNDTVCQPCKVAIADLAYIRRIQRMAEGKEERP